MIGAARSRLTGNLSQAAFGAGAFGGGQTLDNGGNNFFDPVMGLRIDQSWGYASVTGAFHNDNGGYYNNAINSTNAGLANTIVQGHPGDTWGYAMGTGFLLTDFMGLKGDTFGSQFIYGKGATAYVTKGSGTWAMRNGSFIGGGSTLDGIYADGTQIDQSTEWSWAAEYEHFWTPKLHTAVQGGYVSINYDQTATNLICAGAPGFGPMNNSLGSIHRLDRRPAVDLHQWLGAWLRLSPELLMVSGRYAHDLEPASGSRYRCRSPVHRPQHRKQGRHRQYRRRVGRGACRAIHLRQPGRLVERDPHPAELPALILKSVRWFSNPRQRCRGFLFRDDDFLRLCPRMQSEAARWFDRGVGIVVRRGLERW